MSSKIRIKNTLFHPAVLFRTFFFLYRELRGLILPVFIVQRLTGPIWRQCLLTRMSRRSLSPFALSARALHYTHTSSIYTSMLAAHQRRAFYRAVEIYFISETVKRTSSTLSQTLPCFSESFRNPSPTLQRNESASPVTLYLKSLTAVASSLTTAPLSQQTSKTGVPIFGPQK